MELQHFTGFGGARLTAEVLGETNNPLVLLVHGAGQTKAACSQIARALSRAGRRVVNLDLRGHGQSEWPADAKYDIDVFAMDLRAVLAQLDERPVVIATKLGGWVAMCALEKDASMLASGLVLADLPSQLSSARSKALREDLRQKLDQSGSTPNWDVRMLDSLDASVMPARLRRSAPNINIPVLFVRGALMGEESSVQTKEFVTLLPDAEYSEIDQVNHLISDECTDAFNAVLVNFLERKHPRQPPVYTCGSDARTYRDAMGCFATGITVVTAVDKNGTPIGITANSFTSLSLDPPLLLVCIGSNSKTGALLREASHFAINVLQIGQQPTSNLFARFEADRFSQVAWEEGEFGSPTLMGSLGVFECEHHATHEGGDHFVLVGKVIKATFDPRRDPLLFFRGKYRRLHFG